MRKQNSTAKKATRKEPTAHASAVAVMDIEDKRARKEARMVTAFLNGDSPDFLSEAVLRAIDAAFDHFQMSRPQDDCGIADYDEQNLYPLFLKTKLHSPEESEASLARHIVAIVNHPKTPEYLDRKIRDFVTDATNIQSASGESLLDRWTYDPKTIAACVAWANEADDKKEIAAELTANIKANDNAKGAYAGGVQ
jgi:hypothetical protein